MSADLQDWIEWNGKRSSDFGIVVLQQPTILTGQERVEFIDIPGRAGSLAVLQGDHVFNDINLSAKCILAEPYLLQNDNQLFESRIDDICGWLRGNGKIVFGHRPDGYYMGRIANQISFDKAVRGNPHRLFTLEFRCKPFFYFESGGRPVTIVNDGDPGSGTNLFNPSAAGNVDGSYLNATGIIGTGSTASGLSDYISITGGKTYYINTGTTQATRRFCCFYTSDSTDPLDIPGEDEEHPKAHNAQADPWVTAPATATRMRMTYWVATKTTLVKVVEATDTGGEKNLENPGNIPAEPLLKIFGSGTATGRISISDKELFINSFEDISYIYVDTEARIAYKGVKGDTSDPLTLMNGRVSGEWIDIPIGKSTMRISGSITSVELTPRWRTIG